MQPLSQDAPSGEGSGSLHPSTTLARRHRWIGAGWVVSFMGMGIVLAAIDWFGGSGSDQPAREMMDLMWTLAYVHGVMVGLVHLAFAGTIAFVVPWNERSQLRASRCLTMAGVLLPGGFFAGGVSAWDGDPSWGVALVPIGAGLLFAAVLLTARAVSRLE